MTECRSPELQDLLPDYVAETLDSVTAAQITEHLRGCAWCTEDLAVLQMVRRARPRVAVPDISRIVAALPPAPQPTGAVGEFSGPRLVRDVAPATAAAPPFMQRQRSRGAVFGMSVWRVAATLGVVIAGGASLMVARRGVIGGSVRTEAPMVVATGESAAAAAPVAISSETLAVATPATRTGTVSVSYGDLGDYSEAELESMLARLDKWDGATNTEPLPGVPILPTGGGGTP